MYSHENSCIVVQRQLQYIANSLVKYSQRCLALRSLYLCCHVCVCGVRVCANCTYEDFTHTHTCAHTHKHTHAHIQDGEDIFSLGSTMQHQETSNTRLVEILKEENASLKRELECYYQRVRKLQKVSQ